MQRLADVELQLVMQGLTAQEILKLARCSRFLFHAADKPFAWQHTRLCVRTKPEPPVALPRRILGWCQRMLSRQLHSRHLPIEPPLPQLVRHAKVVIRCCWQADVDSHLAILAIASRVPAVYELDCDLVEPDNLALILGSPSMQQLQVLRLSSGWRDYERIKPTTAMAIAQLPHLHTLYLLGSGDDSGLAFLSQAPALTTLHIQDAFNRRSSLLTQVAACSKLVNLSILWPSLYGSDWLKFFARPRIQQLRSLKLDSFCVGSGWEVHGPTQQDLVVAFTSMRHLHTLHLACCDWIDVLLPTLAHAPVLRQLIIETTMQWTYVGTAVSALKALLTAAPLINCLLFMPDKTKTSEISKLTADLGCRCHCFSNTSRPGTLL